MTKKNFNLEKFESQTTLGSNLILIEDKNVKTRWPNLGSTNVFYNVLASIIVILEHLLLTKSFPVVNAWLLLGYKICHILYILY